MEAQYENSIAIIGMAGRFPKAIDIDEFWHNLTKGVNSICKADEERIKASGFSKEILNHSRFVNASSKLEDARYFDADFFGLSNTEAMLMDPQIRLLLQTSWHALEDAGYAVNDPDVSIGNFCGMSTNSYLMNILKTNSLTEPMDSLLYRILNEKDFLATWISYKLNLTGPAMSVQTACSTSLLAIHLACQSLLNRECDMALAGGVSYNSDDSIGYMHVPESIYSKDGVCRPFDKEASGTVPGDGVGSIILKRAEDAIEDNDHIYAIIKGTASNNDGANKQGYTTPSVNYQRDVVLEALAVSDVEPDTIGLIEAHGTGTLIGDPIEVSALTEAFREYTNNEKYCAIGSVKSNIGHLDAAAGIVSVIKTALCINKGFLVPSINYTEPNPSLQLDSSPFYVSQDYKPWPDHFDIRRAGVSSLGVGGTNVHVVLEEPPKKMNLSSDKGPYVITLSALNQSSLQLQKLQLIKHIQETPDIRLEDIEFTSIYGRKVFPYRFSLVCENKEELIAKLSGNQVDTCYEEYGDLTGTVFLFPGQGSQYQNMGLELYSHNEMFKKDMDYCFNYVNSLYGIDYKKILFDEEGGLLNQTENTQICLFIIEYCLAKELVRSGIKPDGFLGHSLGEYVTACIIGCITLEDALKLVYYRGNLMSQMPKGGMVLVHKTQDELSHLLLDTISICAINANDNIVIGGDEKSLEEQINILDLNDIRYRRLKVSHAYHTPMMQGVLESYKEILSEVEFKHFNAKVFSTYTGDIVLPEVFCSKQYWLDQILHPVKFLDAIKQVPDHISNPVFIEVGPGSGLSSFVKTTFDQNVRTIAMLPKLSDKKDALYNLYKGKALLCANGVVFDLPETHKGKRISLPKYNFSKNYFWKPATNVNYNDFDTIANSYHYGSKNYLGERLRATIEVKIDENEKVSEEMLNHLTKIHQQYIDDINKLFSSSDHEKINSRVEVLYKDVLPENGEDNSKSKEMVHRNVSSIFVEPTTDIEKTISVLWGDILGYHPVGIMDNYFEVGGNSLLATQLINKIGKEFDIEISISEVLTNNTIKDLALLVEEKEWLRDEKEFSNEIVL